MSLRPGAWRSFLAARDPGDSRAAGAVDLRTLPRMPGAEVLWREAAVLCYQAPGGLARALIFCSEVLDDRGWSESPEVGLRFVSPIFASACYERAEYSLAFTARPTPGKPGVVTVTLRNLGNLDTRTLPRPQDATLIRSARISTTYVTLSNVRAVADFTRNALTDLGWNDYALLESRRDKRHENQTVQFAKEGISLNVRVSCALTRRGCTLVQYSTSQALDRQRIARHRARSTRTSWSLM
jgi:hypothetical protein